VTEYIPRTLVIGYGNTLRGDDGLGWITAGRLQDILPPDAAIVLTCHQLTPELAEPVSHADLVILIDAAHGTPPGEISCREVLPDAEQTQVLLHAMLPEGLLASVQALYGTTPRMLLWTVNGESFAYGEGLSSAVQTAIPELLAAIQAGLANTAP
jgi:hydrogenase maturation protease